MSYRERLMQAWDGNTGFASRSGKRGPSVAIGSGEAAAVVKAALTRMSEHSLAP